MGVEDILEAVAKMPQRGDADGPLRAMIIDAWFDNYVGVVMLVRVVDGSLKKGERIRLMATNSVYPVDHLGVFTAKSVDRPSLNAGEVGFVILASRNWLRQGGRHGHGGKKLRQQCGPAGALPGFKEIQPQVFAGLYPSDIV